MGPIWRPSGSLRRMRSDLFDVRHQEVSTDERFVLRSKRMLKVTLGADVLATKGAMVAFQGSVKFHHEGAGSVSRMIKKIVTSEELWVCLTRPSRCATSYAEERRISLAAMRACSL